MELKKLILKEIENMPNEYLKEIFDFINFLETKIKEKNLETTLLSESSLKKDWLRQEEDEAWQDL